MGLAFDRVKETTTTTGTGALTLAGAVAQFRTLDSALGSEYNIDVYYTLVDANGTAWETGRGYLTTATNFVRDVVHESSNAGAAINLSAGTHTFFVTATEDMFADMPGKIYAVARGWDAP